MTAKTHIVRIGNSRGIRIPKLLLEQANLQGEVELRAEAGRLVVCAAHQPRTGWAEAAQAMKAAGESSLLDEPTRTEFDDKEWHW